MTATLISLISIFSGIIGANSIILILKKYSFGVTGNSISGVFGSIFIIKSFGRLGFAPNFIVELNHINFGLLAINMIVSFFSGLVAVILISKLKSLFNSAE